MLPLLKAEEALAVTSLLLVKATGAWTRGATNAEAVMVPAINALKMDAEIFILSIVRKVRRGALAAVTLAREVRGRSV
jgi:hypothetical protein